MHLRHVFAFLFALGFAASCRQILGIEEATLICPPEMPDCAVCSTPDDCGAPTECHAWACIDALCTPVNSDARTPCSTGLCSDTPPSEPSECVECLRHDDCPGPGGHCGLGKCFSCFDGVENGSEWGLDCGGPCKGCLGNACSSPEECLSGFCADGTCCTSPCTEICAYCNVPSGGCTALPKYSDDNIPFCNGKYECDGGGGCRLRPGEICMSAVDCTTGRCEKFRCAKQIGETCDHPVDCADNSCVDGICTM